MEPSKINTSHRKQFMRDQSKDVNPSYSPSQSPPKDLSLGLQQGVKEVNTSSLTSQTSSLASSYYSMTPSTTPPSQLTKSLEAYQNAADSPEISASPCSRKEWELTWQKEGNVSTDRNVPKRSPNNQVQSPHGRMHATSFRNPRSLPMHYEGNLGLNNLDSYHGDGLASLTFGVSPNISSRADDDDLDNLLNSFDTCSSFRSRNTKIPKVSPPKFEILSRGPAPKELRTDLEPRIPDISSCNGSSSGNSNSGTDGTKKAIHGTYQPNSISSVLNSEVIKDKSKRGKEQRHTPSQLKATTSDQAVRGGNVFKSFFTKKGANKVASINSGNGNMDQSNRRRRRIHSSPALALTGSLDSTRRGSLYGPITGSESVRSRAQKDETGQMLQSMLKPDKAIRGGSNFLIGPKSSIASMRHSLPISMPMSTVHGESSASSTSSSKSSRERKMKFTEIHNSKDSAAAFLGDEKSGHGGNFFTSFNGNENSTVNDTNCKLSMF